MGMLLNTGVKNPVAGMSLALDIICSDKCGTIYGIHEALEQTGVSLYVSHLSVMKIMWTN
jgi:hypothetical protein